MIARRPGQKPFRQIGLAEQLAQQPRFHRRDRHALPVRRIERADRVPDREKAGGQPTGAIEAVAALGREPHERRRSEWPAGTHEPRQDVGGQLLGDVQQAGVIDVQRLPE
jgi:hypothetical protein